MIEKDVKITRWSGEKPVTEAAIQKLIRDEDLIAYKWSNRPGDVYGAHSHGYGKVIYVIQGSITFGLPKSGQRIELFSGDRLDLPSRTEHDALVGPQGVVCLEAHR